MKFLLIPVAAALLVGLAALHPSSSRASARIRPSRDPRQARSLQIHEPDSGVDDIASIGLLSTPSGPDAESDPLDELDDLRSRIASLLGVSEGIAGHIARLLLDRDRDGARLATLYLADRSEDALDSLLSVLYALDGRTDQAVDLMLSAPQRETYRRCREMGEIHGSPIPLDMPELADPSGREEDE